jgi:hypothetical protein
VIPRARGICFPACEFQVSGLNILHSYRFQIFGQGRYGGSYGRFSGFLARGWALMRGRLRERHACARACSLNTRA